MRTKLLCMACVGFLLLGGCGDNYKKSYGCGYFRGTMPVFERNERFLTGSLKHLYVVSDTSTYRVIAPVVVEDDMGRNIEIYRQIRREYFKEDSTSYLQRPVMVYWRKKWHVGGSNQELDVEYELVGFAPVPFRRNIF